MQTAQHRPLEARGADAPISSRYESHASKGPAVRPGHPVPLGYKCRLDGVARKLRVEVIDEWPAPTDLPTEMGKNLPADTGGRLAVLASMDQEKVDSRTERLLTERFGVPHPNLQGCRETLRTEALLRMRGAAHGVWNRSDIERIQC